jgi:uncharacterized protein (DUF2236 family)
LLTQVWPADLPNTANSQAASCTGSRLAVHGTREEKSAITSVIHRSHAGVKGDGYFADDPELRKWTASTLFMALIVVHETFIGKLSNATKHILFRESAIFATSLRMPLDMWPDTYETFGNTGTIMSRIWRSPTWRGG